ncbi:MAG TPA: peptidoglycan-binding domain-containing protein, partial [Chthoniobacterales bacterium]|nr:peptidoglycan-binding domain-containing protein [Chthoniobacterales bacterium]
TKSNAASETRGKGRASAAEGTNANAPQGTNEVGAANRGKHGRNAKSESPSMANAESSPSGTESTTTAGGKNRHGRNAKNTAETGASASPGASAGTNATTDTGRKGKRGRNTTAGASPSVAPSASAAASITPATATTSASPMTSATAAAATGASAATGANATAATGQGTLKGQGTVGRGGKRVETQQVQQIKQQHASFKAQPKPNVAPAVTFNQNYRISGAERWQGPRYAAFREYHPEMHDRGWYHSHFPRVELIAGGYYYFNNGYWYPAWGYDRGSSYYAYNGPIYVGHSAEPPDKVIADVQAELQDMGYYTGEVDGLLGPLTRQALRDYQADHGLEVTEAIDEPTLQELQLS